MLNDRKIQQEAAPAFCEGRMQQPVVEKSSGTRRELTDCYSHNAYLLRLLVRETFELNKQVYINSHNQTMGHDQLLASQKALSPWRE
jgi:hypothetical protein